MTRRRQRQQEERGAPRGGGDKKKEAAPAAEQPIVFMGGDKKDKGVGPTIVFIFLGDGGRRLPGRRNGPRPVVPWAMSGHRRRRRLVLARHDTAQHNTARWLHRAGTA